MPELLKQQRPWFIQAYFVVATLIGLLLIVFSAVSLVGLGLKEVVGVQPYPNTPMYPMTYQQQTGIDRAQLTAEQQKKFDEMAADFDKQQAAAAEYDQADQQKRMEIASSLAMLIVGIPVFAFHAPHVFKKEKA